MVSTSAKTVEIPSTPKREAMPPPNATPPQSCPAAAARLVMEKEGKMEASVDYEKCREQRIRENRERMQKMGIMDLALKLKSSVSKSAPAFKRPQSQRSTPSPLKSSKDLPRRRSSRLQNTSPIIYSEPKQRSIERSAPKRKIITYEEGAKEEIYSNEHLELLGDCQSSWALFVDGYDSNGRRIYDPVRGKTCHQCRQKTLGHRTHCSSCEIVQGQFCGDCLYMRYGENVLEAIQNPDWICPVCRGICNCSLCRIKRGWAPTGMMYKKALALGYKSVAHYLIQTRMEEKEEEGVMSPPQMSAQRSLTFPDEKEKSETGAEKENTKRKKRSKKVEESAQRSLTFADDERKSETGAAEKENTKRKQSKEEEESADRGTGIIHPTSPHEKKRSKSGRYLPSPDSIAWRLRSRVRASP